MTPFPKPRILAVVGPTASGKTSLAIALAERLGTEIVSADSMQVYRGMAIGTAAPTPDEQARVRHHLTGFLDPGEHYSAGAFMEAAREVVADLNKKGKIAVVAGGSGLYVRALIDGLFEGPQRDPELRARLDSEASEKGVDSLYQRLEGIDPDYAQVILPGDLRRIVRALEVFELTGETFSELHRRHQENQDGWEAIQVAIDLPRETLYARIDARAEAMIEAGFVDEVRQLIRDGYLDRLQSLRTLGYREFAEHVLGEKTFAEALEGMQRNTRRFARRQLSWFRRDAKVHWLMPKETDALVEEVMGVLGNT